ncbi:MAG: hypothetical protein Q4F95_02105 [Oscillospiraceae bacterium]|nr:hypothetical protein [Oscillospiraceae bacterium]
MELRRALNAVTSDDRSGIICDRANPKNYISVTSEERSGENGIYIATRLDVYKDGCKQKCNEFSHGEFNRYHTKGGDNTSSIGEKHWLNIIDEIQKLGFDDVIMLKDNAEYEKYKQDPDAYTKKDKQTKNSTDTANDYSMNHAEDTKCILQWKKGNPYIYSEDKPLYPIINAFVSMHLDKSAALADKKERLEDKVNTGYARIDKLMNRAKHLSDTNAILSNFSSKLIFISAIIEKNEKKIHNIQCNKIPSIEEKIAYRSAKIIKLNFNISVQQCKAARLINLSNMIRNFSVKNNSVRLNEFEKSLSAMNKSTHRLMNLKLQKCENKIITLSSEYKSANTAADKLDIAKKLRKQKLKKKDIEKRKCSIEMPHNIDIDMLNRTADECEKAEKTVLAGGTAIINELPEKICTLASAAAATKTESKISNPYYIIATPDQYADLNNAGIIFESKNPSSNVIVIEKEDKEKASNILSNQMSLHL